MALTPSATPPRSRAVRNLGLLALACLGLAGCTQSHYLVRTPDLPLYAGPTGEEVLTRLPRFHHEALSGDPAEHPGARLPLSYRGLAGWAPREGLLVFSYLDPDLDDGDDRRRAVQRALREAQLEAFGADWPEEVVLAIREGHIRRGMTARQVEVAWGWPTAIEERPDGGARWLYTRDRVQVVHEPAMTTLWFSPYVRGGPGWQLDYTWTARHERIEERRTVVFGPGGRVVAVLYDRHRG